MDWKQWLQFIMSLFPMILEIITMIEKIVGNGQGDGKKKIALSTVDTVAVANNASIEQREFIKNIASLYIDNQVNNLNHANVFNKEPEHLTT